MTMPVATPMAKVTANSEVQKRAAASKMGSRVRRYTASRQTSTTPIPMVSGGNR